MSFEKVNLNTPKTRSSPKKRLEKQMKIVLALAKIEGYDEALRIKDEYGNYIKNSDIITLLNNAMTSGRVLIGQDSFILLLKEAKVPPDLIINDEVRSKLLSMPVVHKRVVNQTKGQEHVKKSNFIPYEIPIKSSKVVIEEAENPQNELGPPLIHRGDKPPIVRRDSKEDPPKIDKMVSLLSEAKEDKQNNNPPVLERFDAPQKSKRAKLKSDLYWEIPE